MLITNSNGIHNGADPTYCVAAIAMRLGRFLAKTFDYRTALMAAGRTRQREACPIPQTPRSASPTREMAAAMVVNRGASTGELMARSLPG